MGSAPLRLRACPIACIGAIVTIFAAASRPARLVSTAQARDAARIENLDARLADDEEHAQTFKQAVAPDPNSANDRATRKTTIVE